MRPRNLPERSRTIGSVRLLLAIVVITVPAVSATVWAQTSPPESTPNGAESGLESDVDSEVDSDSDDNNWLLPDSDGLLDLEAMEELELEWLQNRRLQPLPRHLSEGPYEGLDAAVPEETRGPGVVTVVEVPRAERHEMTPAPTSVGPTHLDSSAADTIAEPAVLLERFDLSGVEPVFGLESIDHDQIQEYLVFYTTTGRRRLARLLSRSGRYADFIRAELRERGLPEELLYLVMIESGFDTTARSHAAAVGLWQFMARTGRAYGLTVGRRFDERRDPVRATEAGMTYLESLYQRMGSWPLAMASYNAGSGHVRSELRRYNVNDFWTMDAYSAIYDDTRRYVYKIIAAAIIGENPSLFGFDAVELEEPIVHETVDVPGNTRLSVFSRAAGCDVDTLRALNPALLVASTPDVPTYTLNLPVGSIDRFMAEYDDYVPGEEGRVTLHALRFGETVEQLAELVDLPERVIRAANGLARREDVPYWTELVIPMAPELAEPALQAAPGPPPAESERQVVITPAQHFRYADRQRVFYEINNGDNLWAIARAFETSVYDLSMWNDVDIDAVLLSGMTLQIFVPEGTDLSAVCYLPDDHVRTLAQGSPDYQDWDEAQERARRARRRTYTVRRGDTVSTIARRFGVRSQDIIRWNGIDNPNRIRAGQVLRVR